MKYFLNCLVVFTFAVCQSASAEIVIYDNILDTTAMPSGAAGVNAFSPADLSAIIGGEVADDVTLSTTTAVTGIQWTGIYSPDALNGGDGILAAMDDDFEIRIYADSPGQPGGLLQSFAVGTAVNRMDSGLDDAASGGDIFDYSAAIDFNFVAGTTYWVSILANTQADPDNFSQGVIGTGGNAFADINPADGDWVFQGFVNDFRLTSPIPEPGMAGILVLSSVAASIRRRR